MKKLMMLILAVMLCAPAMAETPSAVLPVKILEHEDVKVTMNEAIATAQQIVHPDIQTDKVVRATLVELSDGRSAWVVTIFDITRLTYAWYATVDASTGDVLEMGVSDDGFFSNIFNAWTAQKGTYALWSLEDKQLYDALYALQPSYGLPVDGDMPAGQALPKALYLLGMTSSEGYSVGYGYIMGGEDYNGVWEICLVQNGQVVYRVNLDAQTGDLYYMEPDEAGNG